MKNLKEKFIRQMKRFERGKQLASWVDDILLLLLLIKVYEMPEYFLVFIGLLVVLALWIAGTVWQKSGMWEEEYKFDSYEINPIIRDIHKEVTHGRGYSNY